MKYSIIVPVYNRPEEVREFIESITKQTYKNFELIMVDGSPTQILKPVINNYLDKLDFKYFYRKKLGASESRNLGCENSKGEWLVFIDSDCIVPPQYLETVDKFLQNNDIDAFGGPDKADDSFTPVQKAINYAMTSYLTTGGIRGQKKHVGKFQLRGFNMGIKREVFFAVGGFSGMQVAEDIDLSMRLIKAGYKTALIPDAYVFHKRKTNLKKFRKQLFMHGKGRIDLFMRHKDAIKAVHLLPSAFLIYILAIPIIAIINKYLFFISLIPLLIYILALFIDSLIRTKSFKTCILSTYAAIILLTSYGAGFIYNFFKRLVFRNNTDTIKAEELKN